ncbi:MAG: hypothetical protein LWW81_14415 [Rhodocyclales bacterium]|nr:hypothetical protein [Rhodocyclales bacterium]
MQKPATPSPRGLRIALIFALAAHPLHAHYEYGKWLTDAQAAQLAADWLTRQKLTLAQDERRHLASLADTLARQISQTLSREAGLFTAHEMMESLDPRHHSEIAETLMVECERLFDSEPFSHD